MLDMSDDDVVSDVATSDVPEDDISLVVDWPVEDED